MKEPLTIFMFGYWGWGNATDKLVEAVDAVEKQRGFKPPFFVDIRVHRTVRAVGFRDDNFEQVVGRSRHEWMPDLGNVSVLPKYRSDKIRLKSPKAAETLLASAVERSKRRQRTIFFCSCEFPCGCHRYEVARLLIKAAKRQGIQLKVIEWPGGEPSNFDVKVPRRAMAKDKSSRLYLADVQPKAPLAQYAGLALGSIVDITSDGRERAVAVAPAMYAPNGWYLPILWGDNDKAIPGTTRAAHAWRKDCGYLPLRTNRNR